MPTSFIFQKKLIMIHRLANLPVEYKSKVELTKNDLDDKDDPMTLDCMFVDLDAKYEKIYKKNNYDPENEDKTKGKRRNHVETGVTYATITHSETTPIHRTTKMSQICHLQIIIQMQITMQIQI